MDPRNQGEKSRRGFLYKEDNDDPFSWRFLIVFNKEDAHNGGKMAASGGMSDKFCNKVNDSLLSKHIFVNWQIIPREDGPTYTYMLVDRPFNHYSSSIFRAYKEKRAQKKQKGAMGGKIEATFLVYVAKLLNSCKKQNIIEQSDVGSPIISSGNQYILAQIPCLSIILFNIGIRYDVPSVKCPKACIDLYSLLQQQFNFEKKSMNVCFQIIPENSSYEVSQSHDPLKQPCIAQVEIKPSKAKRVVTPKSEDDLTRRSSKHHWKPQENVRYCQFIKNNIELCKMTQYQKIKAKFNVRMSKVVKTKDPAQCRSHNQKMMIKYGTPEDIIKGLGKDFNFFKKEELFQARNEQVQADQEAESGKDREVQDIFKVVGQEKRVY